MNWGLLIVYFALIATSVINGVGVGIFITECRHKGIALGAAKEMVIYFVVVGATMGLCLSYLLIILKIIA